MPDVAVVAAALAMRSSVQSPRPGLRTFRRTPTLAMVLNRWSGGWSVHRDWATMTSPSSSSSSASTTMVMMMMTAVVFTMIALWPSTIQSRRLQRCQLAGELYILDIPKVELPLWLCIAEFESRFNTDVIGTRNADDSRDYGLFQINERYWCLPENQTDFYVFNECNVNCSALIADDITESVKCARRIKHQQGWTAWSVYEPFCNQTNADDLEKCFQ